MPVQATSIPPPAVTVLDVTVKPLEPGAELEMTKIEPLKLRT
jgi:hypothetical protein